MLPNSMRIIPERHDPLKIGDTDYDLSHLEAFTEAFRGKGHEAGTDLPVLIKFSNHVFTKRMAFGQPFDTVDHLGRKRSFDPARYNMSLRLPDLVRRAIRKNALCFVSRDFEGHENLVHRWVEDGDIWWVVFCFKPLGKSVVLEVLSAHERNTDGIQKRNHISYFARKCLFQQSRFPTG